MTDRGWEVEFYADEDGREPCREWAEGLSPVKRAAFIAAVEVVLSQQGINLVRTDFGKALGEGLYELRIRQTADEIRQRVAGLPSGDLGRRSHEPLLLRVYFCTDGPQIILLLSGHDKRKHSSTRRQSREIENARKFMRAHKAAKQRAAKAARKGPRSI